MRKEDEKGVWEKTGEREGERRERGGDRDKGIEGESDKSSRRLTRFRDICQAIVRKIQRLNFDISREIGKRRNGIQ